MNFNVCSSSKGTMAARELMGVVVTQWVCKRLCIGQRADATLHGVNSDREAAMKEVNQSQLVENQTSQPIAVKKRFERGSTVSSVSVYSRHDMSVEFQEISLDTMKQMKRINMQSVLAVWRASA